MGKALIIKGADFSAIAVDTIEIAVSAPVISISITGQVTITSPDGDDIYYTTDGSTPTASSTKYTAPFNVQNGTTVKAVCCKSNNYSSVASSLYDGTLQAPVISIASNGVVTITATDNASIRYTTDGSTPTSTVGTVYNGTFQVQNGTIIKAIAYITEGGSTISSTVSSATADLPEIMFGKKFGYQTPTPPYASFNIVDDEDCCICPWIDLFDGDGTIASTEGFAIVWTHNCATAGAERDDICLVTSEDKTTCNEFWASQSGYDSRSMSGTTQLWRYVRASFLIGYAGSVEVKRNGVTVAKYEYNGGADALTATWERTV